MIEPGEDAPSGGGRRPATLVFNPGAGVALAADLGATRSRLAVSDMAGMPVAERSRAIEIRRGPAAVLSWVDEGFAKLLAEAGARPRDVRAIGVGVPGPVELTSGHPINPPIMPGWHGYDLPRHFASSYAAPTLVDNDVNIMALGEHQAAWPNAENLLFIKVGTGIGCGIIAGHRVHRGRDGAAGDIGHIRVSGRDDVICECGNSGCLEIVAGGRALIREARRLGSEAKTSGDIVDLVRAQNVDVVRLVRQAGRYLGEALAGLVNALNPSVIVIGGDVAEAHEQLFAGVREVVYQRSTPLATQQLEITRSVLGKRAGVVGASVLATEHVLAPAYVDRQLAGDG